MTLSSALKLWKGAVECLEADRVREGLEKLESISPQPTPGIPRARIAFNIGCAYKRMGQLTNSLKSFTGCIEKDSHMAVGFHLRACVHFKLQNYSEAASDFEEAHSKLRGKNMIDYTQLGLWYKLYACESLYNAALCHARQCNLTTAIDFLLRAQKVKVDKMELIITSALTNVNVDPSCLSRLELFELDKYAMFRPPKDKANVSIRDHNFLGTARVVAAVDINDQKVGFQGKYLTEEGSSHLSVPISSQERGSSKSADDGIVGKIRRALSPDLRQSHGRNLDNVPPPPDRPLPPPPVTSPEITLYKSVNTNASSSAFRQTFDLVPSATQLHYHRKLSSPTFLPNNQPPNTQSTKVIALPPQYEFIQNKVESGNSDLPPKLPPRTSTSTHIGSHSPQTAHSHGHRIKPTKSKPAIVARSKPLPGLPVNLPSKEVKITTNPNLRQKIHNQPVGKKQDSSRAPNPIKPVPTRPAVINVKLSCNTTTTLMIKCGTSLLSMLDRACEHFDLHQTAVDLWYLDPDTNEFKCIENEDIMQEVWRSKVKDNSLSLSCFAKQ